MADELSDTPPSLPVPANAERFGRLGLAVVAGAVLFVVLTIAVGLYILLHIKGRDDAYRNEVNRLQESGTPTNVLELNSMYHHDPKADLLGDELMRVFGEYDISLEMRDGVEFHKKFARLGGTMPEADAAHLQEHLAANELYMTHLRQVARASYEIRYPIDLKQGIEAEFSFAPHLKNAERMLAAAVQAAVFEARDEDIPGTLIDAVFLAETLRDAPILLLQYYRKRGYESAREQIEFAINSRKLARQDIADLLSTLQSVRFDGMTAFGLAGDRANFGLPIQRTKTFTSTLKSYLPRTVVTRLQIENAFLAYSEVIRIGDLLPWERSEAGKRFDEKLGRMSTADFPLHGIEMILLPAVEKSFATEHRAIAKNDTAVMSLGVLLYCLDEKKLPNTLSDLVPKYCAAEPFDVFTGKPLGYAQRGDGFVVYSVGENLRDDGGSLPPGEKRRAREGDIVFRVLDASPYLESN